MKTLALVLAATLTAACGSHGEQPNATAPAPHIATSDLEDPRNDPGDTPASRPVPAPVNAETVLLPPGVQPRRGGALAPGEAAVSYTAAVSPQTMLAWYRSPQRHTAFSVDSELVEGAEHVLSGRLSAARGDFTVRIAAAPSGGTTAMVLVTGR